MFAPLPKVSCNSGSRRSKAGLQKGPVENGQDGQAYTQQEFIEFFGADIRSKGRKRLRMAPARAILDMAPARAI